MSEWSDLCWIWYGARAESDRVTRCFRHWVELTNPQSAWLHIMAECGYVVYVNGQLAARNNNSHACWRHDVSAFLRPGANLIAIEATMVRYVPDGLLAFGEVAEAGGGVTRIMTNPSWEATTNPEDEWYLPDKWQRGWDRAIPLEDVLAPGQPGTRSDPSPAGYSLDDSKEAISRFDPDIFEGYVARFLPGRRPVEGARVLVAHEAMFPSIVPLSNGELLAAIRGGAGHTGIEGRIDVVRSTDRGRTWSQPETAVAGEWDDRNNAIGQMPNGDVVIMYNVYKSFRSDGTFLEMGPDDPTLRQPDLRMVISRDNGHNWEGPFELGIPASPYEGRIVLLRDGTALVPLRYLPPESGAKCAALARSRDNGRTWGDVTTIAAYHTEPPMLELPDGRLMCFTRRQGDGVSLCWSFDKGYTWTDPLPFTGPLEHPACPVLLRDGRILVTYGYRKFPFGVRGVISRDYGRTWDWENELIVAWDACSADCGYPATVELPTGDILTMYYVACSKIEPGLGTHVKGIIYRV